MIFTLKGLTQTITIQVDDSFIKDTVLEAVSLLFCKDDSTQVDKSPKPTDKKVSEVESDTVDKFMNTYKASTCEDDSNQTDKKTFNETPVSKDFKEEDCVKEESKEKYRLPLNLSAEDLFILEQMVKHEENIIQINVGKAHGEDIFSYSKYEVVFLNMMLEARFPTEDIYKEFIRSPYCMGRSLAGVRTRLSIIKHHK